MRNLEFNVQRKKSINILQKKKPKNMKIVKRFVIVVVNIYSVNFLSFCGYYSWSEKKRKFNFVEN